MHVHPQQLYLCVYAVPYPAGLVMFLPRRQNKTGTNLLSEGGNFTTQKVGYHHQLRSGSFLSVSASAPLLRGLLWWPAQCLI
jgi:hypothetical protein